VKHWICRIRSDHGEQYGHIESLETPHSGMHSHIIEVDSGPADTAGEAWGLWHVKKGNLAKFGSEKQL